MTELEYRLMSVIASTIDRVVDFSDDLDEFACEVVDEEDYNKAHELADRLISIIDLLTDAFNKSEKENKEEWYNLQKAESRIISNT